MVKKCNTCGQAKTHIDGELDTCSEFCARMSDAELEAFRSMKPGDFGLWPCHICGCVIEDVYILGSCCLPCVPKKNPRAGVELLKEARAYGMPEHLMNRVDEFIAAHDSD